jgi:hypothetical protein
MRSTVAWLLVTSVAACDLNEGPSEEAREAQEGMELEGAGDGVRNDVNDLDGTADARTGAMDQGASLELDRELDQAEAWLAEARREIEAGTRSANAATKDALNAVENDIKAARSDLDRLVDQAADDRAKLEAQIRQKIAEIEATTSRLDAAGDPAE